MGLLFWGVDLQPCKTMTDTLAPVERTSWGVTSLEFYPRPEWCPFSLVEQKLLISIQFFKQVFL